MMRASRCLRVIFLAALPMLLLAASWAPLLQSSAQFDPHQLRMNESRWRAMPEDSRQELRRSWQEFSVLPEAERERYVQRMDNLRRMTSVLRRVLGREPRAAELDLQLEQARLPVQAWIEQDLQLDESVEGEPLREATESTVVDRIGAYLDELVEAGRLDGAARSRILGQPLSLVIRDALGLRAAERQRAGDEVLAEDAREIPADYAESLRLSEREGPGRTRSPAGRGDGTRDARNAEPLRMRLSKLVFIADQLRQSGMSPTQVHDALMLPADELDRVVSERLGER